MTVFDYELDETFDLVFDDNGDFVEIESTIQHQKLLLLTEKGEWDGATNVGVGTQNYLLNEAPEELVLEVRRQFKLDGMEVGKFTFYDFFNLTIPAQYADTSL